MEEKNINEEGGIMERFKESPRTVSALIIILIVAAAIYAFSGEDRNKQAGQTNEQAGNIAADQDEATEPETKEADESTSEQPSISSDGQKLAANNQKLDQNQQLANPPREARRTDTAFVEVAEAGNGITHLSRRAANRWLGENQVSYSITKEHRIYIEDYIKDKIGSQSLELNEEVSISFDLVNEAVQAAGELTEDELSNLTQYTYALE